MDAPELPNGYVVVPRGGTVSKRTAFLYRYDGGRWMRDIAFDSFTVVAPYGEGSNIIAVPKADEKREW